METGARWGRDDASFIEALQKTEDRKRLSELNHMHTMAVDRWFLLLMKSKYAGRWSCMPSPLIKLTIDKAETVSNSLFIFARVFQFHTLFCPAKRAGFVRTVLLVITQKPC